MDLNQLDARAASERGAWMQICHPVTGKPVMDGKKQCRVKVLGTESRVGQTVLQGADRRALADMAEKDVEAAFRQLVRDTVPLIIGFENVKNGDRDATASDAEWFLSLQTANGQAGQKSFLEQVRSFALNRGHYLGNDSAA